MLACAIACSAFWQMRSAEAQQQVATADDIRLFGQVLHFLSSAPTGAINLAIVYNPASALSRGEAQHAARLLEGGFVVGNITLKATLVDQAMLIKGGSYGAIMAVNGADPGLLQAAVDARHIPCLTTHVDQVRGSGCTVAVQSSPSVSIMLNQASADKAGIRFAIAFRMMVQEL